MIEKMQSCLERLQQTKPLILNVTHYFFKATLLADVDVRGKKLC